MTFIEVLQKFEYKHPEFTRIPSEKYSTSRMGGWLLKDSDDMYIGFISNNGNPQVVEIAETTPDNIPDVRGVITEKYKEFKKRHKKC